MTVLLEQLPDECMTGTFHSHGGVALAVTVIGLLGAIYSLAKGFSWLREETNHRRTGHHAPDRRMSKSWLLGLWVLLPPLWLYVEDIFLYRHYGKAACFESFRYAQEIVAKGWLVVVAVLTLLYFGREIFGRE
jgi:hypothetical protein